MGNLWRLLCGWHNCEISLLQYKFRLILKNRTRVRLRVNLFALHWTSRVNLPEFKGLCSVTITSPATSPHSAPSRHMLLVGVLGLWANFSQMSAQNVFICLFKSLQILGKIQNFVVIYPHFTHVPHFYPAQIRDCDRGRNCAVNTYFHVWTKSTGDKSNNTILHNMQCANVIRFDSRSHLICF